MHGRLKSFSDVMPQVYIQVVIMLLPSLVQPAFLHPLQWNMAMALHSAFSSHRSLIYSSAGIFSVLAAPSILACKLAVIG